MENENGKKLEHRITSIEKDVEFICLQVSNHIPTQIKGNKEYVDHQMKSMLSDVSDVKTKLWWIVTFMLANFATLIFILIRDKL